MKNVPGYFETHLLPSQVQHCDHQVMFSEQLRSSNATEHPHFVMFPSLELGI